MTPGDIVPRDGTEIVPHPALSDLVPLILAGVEAANTRRAYGRCIAAFLAWCEAEQRRFNRSTVLDYRRTLQENGSKPSSINQQLVALRALARECESQGWLDAVTTGGILRVQGVKQRGQRAGMWLSLSDAQRLLSAPDGSRHGKRDAALLSLLLGAALRRSEAANLIMEHWVERDGRRVILDLRGKHGRIRTVPVPAWADRRIQAWLRVAGITEGPLLRRVDRWEHIGGGMSDAGVAWVVKRYSAQLGLGIAAHDLRRSASRLWRSHGAELDAIKVVLGHECTKTTEVYIGDNQNLRNAPCDLVALD